MTELEKQGSEIEQILRHMDIDCRLEQFISNDLVDRFEFSLPMSEFKNFTKIKKAVEIMRLCKHKNYQQAESQDFQFAIEVKKENGVLDLLEYNNKFNNGNRLSALIGIDNSNNPIFYDVQKSIHSLIGGSTGMGKTSIINNILYSLTAQNKPSQLQLYLIDIKKTLTMWKDLPHLASKPVETSLDALYTLRSISRIMSERHKQLANKGLSKANADTFPYIIIVIDELADLMLSGVKASIESEIEHIAQLGRSVNISLILATQNPIVKVCTSNIKANCPTRIALKTISSANSKVILDETDAAKLEGVGYAIMRCAGDTTKRKFKACFLNDEQIKDYLKGGE